MKLNKQHFNYFENQVARTDDELRKLASEHANAFLTRKAYDPSVDFLQMTSVDQNVILTAQEIQKMLQSNSNISKQVAETREAQNKHLLNEIQLFDQIKGQTTPQKQSLLQKTVELQKSGQFVEQLSKIPLNFTAKKIQENTIKPAQKQRVPNLKDIIVHNKKPKPDRGWELEEQIRQMAAQKQSILQKQNAKKTRAVEKPVQSVQTSQVTQSTTDMSKIITKMSGL